MSIRGIIDRVEGDYVLVEMDGGIKPYPRNLFPKEFKAGDVVIINGNSIRIDKKETINRQKKIKNLMDSIWEDWMSASDYQKHE